MTEPSRPPSPSALRRALRRARDGVALDETEATVLLAARGADLDDLLSSAARVRDAGLTAAGRPGTVTYSRKVFIPLTHLCRDRCHYCTFATTPNRLAQPFLSVDEVLDIARQGAALGCKEALFTLGDRPEDRWPAARDWLDSRGYGSTLDYVRACAIAVLEQTGLLPHLNPGVLTWEDLARLKPVAPSMGTMLEPTASRLWSEPARRRLQHHPHARRDRLEPGQILPRQHAGVEVWQQSGLLQHRDRARPDIVQGGAVAAAVQPVPGGRPAVLGAVAESEQRLLATQRRALSGDVEYLVDRQERLGQPVRD